MLSAEILLVTSLARTLPTADRELEQTCSTPSLMCVHGRGSSTALGSSSLFCLFGEFLWAHDRKSNPYGQSGKLRYNRESSCVLTTELVADWLISHLYRWLTPAPGGITCHGFSARASPSFVVTHTAFLAENVKTIRHHWPGKDSTRSTIRARVAAGTQGTHAPTHHTPALRPSRHIAHIGYGVWCICVRPLRADGDAGSCG